MFDTIFNLSLLEHCSKLAFYNMQQHFFMQERLSLFHAPKHYHVTMFLQP